MERMVALSVLVVLLLNCAPKLPHIMYLQHVRDYRIAISARVGETIDAEERKQFDLFHAIEEFKEATFYVISGGGYELEIVTETKRLASVNHDRDAVIILREYIEKYEEIKNDRTPWESKWEIIDYDTLGVPITKHEVGRVVDRGHAIGCGVASGCVAAPVAGILLAYAAISETEGADIGVGIGSMIVGFGLGAVAGLATGCVTGYSVYQQDRKNVVKVIKEARKPKIVE